MWAREVAFSARLCRMADVVLLKFSFVFTDQNKILEKPSHTSQISVRGKKLAFKSKAITLAANPTGSIKKITEIKLTYNTMHRS